MPDISDRILAAEGRQENGFGDVLRAQSLREAASRVSFYCLH